MKNLRDLMEESPAYAGHLMEKARVSKKRKRDFPRNRDKKAIDDLLNPERLHLGKVIPYEGISLDPNEPINSYNDLANAIRAIRFGGYDHSDFKEVNGIDKTRLQVAQLLSKNNIPYDVSDITGLSLDALQLALNYPSSRFE